MGQDIFENEMRVVDGVDYLRGLKGDNSVIIPFSQIKGILGNLIITSKSDVNDITAGEWMYISSPLTNYPFSTGYLMALGSSDQMIQFAIKADGLQIKIRIKIYSGWTVWKSITLT